MDKYADLLRLSATCPGNDDRLGGNEAPPAVISVFLGDPLVRIMDALAQSHEVCGGERRKLLTGVKSLPLLTVDDADRNRTSPFAFTGNKFEFRMVGSSQSIGLVNAVINGIVADTLRGFADRLEAAEDKGAAVRQIVRDSWLEHRRVVFNGNNYSAEWAAEARRRGLPCLDHMAAAARPLSRPRRRDVHPHQDLHPPASATAGMRCCSSSTARRSISRR